MKKTLPVILFILFFAMAFYACRPIDAPFVSGVEVQEEESVAEEVAPIFSPVGTQELEIYEEGARIRYCLGDTCLMLEFLADDLLHGEYANEGTFHDLSQPIAVSPMIYKTDYSGPQSFSVLSNGSLVTNAMRASIDSQLCFTVYDIQRQPEWQMATICPEDMEGYRKHLAIQSPDITHIYGLGEQFLTAGETDGNWYGRARFSGVEQGNAMVSFDGAMVGNAQFSIAYFLGEGNLNYALFIDNPAVQLWDFRDAPWDINVAGNTVRFYVMSGADLPDLREEYMALTGTPPVPPRKMFGLWVSEYGYDNWEEMEEKLATLRAQHFPVDGFVLDLLWFGGITPDSPDSRMGSLDWDTINFPDPEGHIARYADEGIGIITIEESYISAGLVEHETLAGQGYLVRECEGCDPVYLAKNPWWGLGGMIDWTNPEAGSTWHDWKRQPLIEAGVIGHWTDLGEPEAFAEVSWYYGVPDEYGTQNSQFDVHNLYNFYWSESIYEGYQRNNVTQRPFILSRSGAPGSQRFGVSMWSGDIASNLDSLAAHLQVQMQMSFSGMDYFGSDIGGFNRYALVGDINDVYTPWLAAGVLLDVPVRVHAQNLCNCQETAPDRVGDVGSNLANVRLRYELSPYLYSLAHRAYLYGEPIFPPLVYYYQDDEAVRNLGGEKLIGRDLLAAFSARLYQEYLDLYLPAGDWVNYHTDEWLHSEGEWFELYPLEADGVFRLPLMVRSGAILPLMYVDDQTMDITGLRLDGNRHDELILRVIASPEPSSFTLYEDDGVSSAYRDGAVRTTLISQQQEDNRVEVWVAAAEGSFDGAPIQRNTVVELVMDDPGKPDDVTLNDLSLPEADSEEVLETLDSGWYFITPNRVRVKTGVMNVDIEKVVQVIFAP